MKVLSVKVPETLDRRVRAAVRHRKIGKSALVRDALERYLDDPGVAGRGTFLDLAGDLVGCIKDAPPDLSTNPKYLADLGK
jgi:hypothetical protein